jgi:hypothetical protein
VRAGSARLLGIAHDARVVEHFAQQRTEIERMRAELPAALAKAGVPLSPPDSANTAKRDESAARGPE